MASQHSASVPSEGSRSLRHVRAAQLRARVEVPYRLGLRYPDAATLDPAALTRGLAGTVRRHGVRLYPYTPVLGLTSRGLVLATGTLRARTVVLALNGFLIWQVIS